jgi:putative ABC transport system permease protein
MGIIRNVFRRKFRAFLTIFGIVIGILALVMMGSVAEKLTRLVDGGIEYYGDKVTVSDSTAAAISGFTSVPLSTDKISELEKVDGAEKASAQLMMTLDKEMSTVNLGIPPMVTASDFRSDGLEKFKIYYSAGRALGPEDRGKVVIGSGLVKRFDAKVGKTVTIRDRQFEIVGIMEPTLTAPDSEVVVPMADLQEIFYETLPPIVKQSLDPYKLATGIVVYAKEGVDPNQLADKINIQVKGVKADGPAVFEKQVAEPMKPFKAIIFGVALISLIVGGLSIINTMTMSVSERTREIGIRKAIGASEGKIIRQFLAESALIGLLGGVFGLLLGWGLIVLLNKAGEANNMAGFLLTTRLAVGSLVFALLLGIISGLYPAWYASRLDPVKALRYE